MLPELHERCTDVLQDGPHKGPLLLAKSYHRGPAGATVEASELRRRLNQQRLTARDLVVRPSPQTAPWPVDLQEVFGHRLEVPALDQLPEGNFVLRPDIGQMGDEAIGTQKSRLEFGGTIVDHGVLVQQLDVADHLLELIESTPLDGTHIGKIFPQPVEQIDADVGIKPGRVIDHDTDVDALSHRLKVVVDLLLVGRVVPGWTELDAVATNFLTPLGQLNRLFGQGRLATAQDGGTVAGCFGDGLNN